MSFTPDTLHVIAVISNPLRFQSRWTLYRQFEEMCRAAGVHLVTVEATFGERKHEVTQHENRPGFGDPLVDHIQVYHRDEIWLKENLVNIGVASLPHDWKYVAWVDADISFVRSDWAVETIHQLQHYPVIQMWRNCIDTGPKGETLQVHQSMGYSWVHGIPYSMGGPDQHGYGAYWHSGYAWACTRQAWDTFGGLMDRAVAGSGDHHMALALVGQVSRSLPGGTHPGYDKMVLDWAERAKALHKNVGYMEGTILHHWHGKKSDRRYNSRWSILREHRFDPSTDLVPDYRGVLHLTAKGERLRHPMRMYFRSRNEDSIDTE